LKTRHAQNQITWGMGEALSRISAGRAPVVDLRPPPQKNLLRMPQAWAKATLPRLPLTTSILLHVLVEHVNKSQQEPVVTLFREMEIALRRANLQANRDACSAHCKVADALGVAIPADILAAAL
jgi:hypothetical protein